MNVNENKIRLQIWDTAGQEKYRTLNASKSYNILDYYKSVLGVVLMYSITDRKSFENVLYWLKSLEEKCNTGISCVLVGNKKDLSEKREVRYEEGKELAKRKNILFFETSAKTGECIGDVFKKIAEQIIVKNPNIVVSNNTQKLTNKTQGKSNDSCC